MVGKRLQISIEFTDTAYTIQVEQFALNEQHS